MGVEAMYSSFVLASILTMLSCTQSDQQPRPTGDTAKIRSELEAIQKELEQAKPSDDAFLRLNQLLDVADPPGGSGFESVYLRCCQLVAGRAPDGGREKEIDGGVQQWATTILWKM